MRILFDHCTPRPLRALLQGHDVQTAYEMGWQDKDNGDLIRAAESSFELFVSTDKSMRYQQNLRNRRLAILVIPQVMKLVEEHAQEFIDAVDAMNPGDYRELSW